MTRAAPDKHELHPDARPHRNVESRTFFRTDQMHRCFPPFARRRRERVNRIERWMGYPCWVHARGSERPSHSGLLYAANVLRLCVVAGVAATVAADLAAPDGHEGTRVAVRTAPCQDVAIGGLDDGKDVT